MASGGTNTVTRKVVHVMGAAGGIPPCTQHTSPADSGLLWVAISTRPLGGLITPSSSKVSASMPLVPANSLAATFACSPSHQADIRWKASHAASSLAARASTSTEAPAVKQTLCVRQVRDVEGCRCHN